MSSVIKVCVVVLIAIMLSGIIINVLGLNAIMTSGIMVNVVLLTVIIPNVVAPFFVERSVEAGMTRGQCYKLFAPVTSGPNVIKLFSSVINEVRNKLECLSLARLYSLV